MTAMFCMVPGVYGQPSVSAINVHMVSEDGRPLPGVIVEGTSQAGIICRTITDNLGRGTLRGCSNDSTTLHISAHLQGYMPAATDINAKDETNLEIALSPEVDVQQSVTVESSPQSVLAESSSSETKLPVASAKYSPLRPNTVVEALPLVPGVIRTPAGRVQISGRDEEHSSLLINSVVVNDPATGGFGLSVPIDTVDLLKVMQSPYLAQYGSFTAGVVSAETRPGGEKWEYSLNDPFPDWRIRSWHLEGVRDASPRLNLGGPLIKNHLYFVEGFEYLVDNAQVRTLPHPVNETRSNAVNSFTQIDAVPDSRNAITATFHFAPHSIEYANLNYFDPQPVTPNADYEENTGTIAHRFSIGRGLLTSIFAGTRVATNVYGQSQSAMVLSPVGNSGSYYSQQGREATRFQWIETWSPANVRWHGQHALQIGGILAHAEDQGTAVGHDVSIVNSSGQLLRRISFAGSGTFSVSDFEPAVYAQDHWVVDKHLAIDAGLRYETQTLTYTSRFAPRGGLAWSPLGDGSTVIRGGLGIFYDSIPLQTYAFSSYPEQVVTTYDGNGNITDGPRRYLNLTSESPSRCLFIHQGRRDGNFAPYSVAWNIEGERVVNQYFSLRLRYLHADARNQLTLTPQTSTSESALVLAGSGALQTHQFEFTSRLGAEKERQFFFSYVRQFAGGDITDASAYLGDFPFPVVRSQITARTTGEIPNRFLLWGTTKLPWRMHIWPRVEYRNGFTWQPVDQFQNYISLVSAAQPRYPAYFTADLRVGKDFTMATKHAVRISLTFRNLTDHNNPLQVHNNSGDPLYGSFFGNYGRHLLADFDFLF
ncbi:TonB-dependent receptor [Edaphobacter bradus]|uniref:hypothetical protein n=1 Tax=Edaphobacter bradus TaxID=2259016 RepID=UPI0021DFE493|nr:hypothetical protein [Edaphobacter bradus]